MTEREYIRATNLAKIRAVKAVLRDYNPEDQVQEDEAGKVWRLLDGIEERLTRQVTTRTDGRGG